MRRLEQYQDPSSQQAVLHSLRWSQGVDSREEALFFLYSGSPSPAMRFVCALRRGAACRRPPGRAARGVQAAPSTLTRGGLLKIR